MTEKITFDITGAFGIDSLTLIRCNLDPRTCGYYRKGKGPLSGLCQHPDAPKSGIGSIKRTCKTKPKEEAKTKS